MLPSVGAAEAIGRAPFGSQPINRYAFDSETLLPPVPRCQFQIQVTQNNTLNPVPQNCETGDENYTNGNVNLWQQNHLTSWHQTCFLQRSRFAIIRTGGEYGGRRAKKIGANSVLR